MPQGGVTQNDNAWTRNRVPPFCYLGCTPVQSHTNHVLSARQLQKKYSLPFSFTISYRNNKQIYFLAIAIGRCNPHISARNPNGRRRVSEGDL